MTKKDLQLAYALAIVCFVVGIISYAAFPAKTPDTPLRLMFHSSAGKIWFDHATHSDQAGYGISCEDCHHYTDTYNCGECHALESDDETVPKRSDAFHQQCIDCHKEGGAGPEDCSGCHVM